MAYLRRYGRLTPAKFITSYYLGMMIPSSILSLFMIASIMTMFYAGFIYHGYDISPTVVMPSSALGIIEVMGLALLTSLLMQAILFLLGVAAMNTSLKHVSRIAMIPFIIVFISFYTSLFLSLPEWALLINPFMALMDSIVTTYTGLPSMPSQLSINMSGAPAINHGVPLTYGILSTIAWTIALTAAAVPLINKIKYKPPEEAREL